MTQLSTNSATENEITETNVSGEEDYKLIEDALLQNPRGRWFLEEYVQRNRPEDTQKLLSAIQRIENTLTEKQAAPASQDIDPIRMSIIEMSKAIAKTREEIASIKPEDDQNNQILTATEELSAIVESTENATNTILEAAEEIQEAAWSLRETGAENDPCDKIDAKTTDIYTACSFQDITGQRTTKVVQALCYIENRVNAMIDIWDLQDTTSEHNKGPIQENTDTRPDSHLLNGPALHDDGLKQNSIDTMLTETADTSDQSSVDEMSFDAIGETTDVTATSENMVSEDVDAMGFNAIEVEEPVSPEPVNTELASTEPVSTEVEEIEPELAEIAAENIHMGVTETSLEESSPETAEISMDLPDQSVSSELSGEEIEQEITDLTNVIDSSTEQAQGQVAEQAPEQIAEQEAEPASEQEIGNLEINEEVPEQTALDEDNMLIDEAEAILATDLVAPATNPIDDAPEDETLLLDETATSLETQAPTDAAAVVEPQSPIETNLEENNPLLQESNELEDLDIAEFETNLAATSSEEMTEGCPPLDPMATTPDIEPAQGLVETSPEATDASLETTDASPENVSEMDFGDIEVTDLEVTSLETTSLEATSLEISDLESPVVAEDVSQEISSPDISAPDTSAPEMASTEMNPAEIDISEIEVAEANPAETPVVAPDQLNNIEDLDIENLTENQEQALLAD